MTETRAEKAQRLVDEAGVNIVMRWNDAYEAEVSGERFLYGTYLYDNRTFYCECQWGQHHSYTDDLCAHALAVKLAVEKEGTR